jgi:hypothetical protein
MEDASGVDLDWFWRGWFYGIDAVDVSMDSLLWYKADLQNDPVKKTRTIPEKVEKPFDDISKIRNKERIKTFEVDKDPDLVDFYNSYRPWETADSVQMKVTYLYDETYDAKEKERLYGKKNYYQLAFTNKGGLVMPLVLEWTFEDGTKEVERIPAEIWRKNENKVTKVFVKDKVAKSVKLDPFRETADIDERNNTKPMPAQPTLFKVYKKDRDQEQPNPMQKAKMRGEVKRP